MPTHEKRAQWFESERKWDLTVTKKPEKIIWAAIVCSLKCQTVCSNELQGQARWAERAKAIIKLKEPGIEEIEFNFDRSKFAKCLKFAS